MKPHIHAELIKAWADGAEIQTLVKPDWGWEDVKNPCWDENNTYRIKPKTNNDIVYETHIKYDFGWKWINTTSTVEENLRLVFDGTTGKLKSAEVL